MSRTIPWPNWMFVTLVKTCWVQEIFQQLAALVPSANLKMKHFGDRYCTVRCC